MRAQQIVDMILDSERYTKSKAFADRVYRDEPILRTGASAFERGDTDRGKVASPHDRAGQVRQAARDAAAQRQVRIPTPDAAAQRQGRIPERPPMPAQYRKMRALERKQSSWDFRYGTSGAKLFYEQGKLMEDFEDDYRFEVSFSMYYPTYYEMSDEVLRGYFSWRTRLRAGEVPPAPVSFLFVHAYELLCGIGVTPGMDGYEALERFRAQYAGTSTAFDAHMLRWTHDYVVYHGLDVPGPKGLAGSFPVSAVAMARRAEQALLERDDPGSWPDEGAKGLPAATELFDGLCSLSRYRAERSRFFKRHREESAEVVAHVFARMVQHCHRRRKVDYVDGLFGGPTRVSYTVFPSAMFWSPTPHADAQYQMGEAETYVCERGFWWRQLPCRKTDTNRELGALLHAIDARMRLALGDAPPLKEKGLPKYQAKFVDEEIAALMERRAAKEAATIRIDRVSLGEIRAAAARTREALLTDDEREEPAPGMPAVGHEACEAPAPAAPTRPAAAPLAQVAAAQGQTAQGLGLSDEQVSLLRSLLGEDDGAGVVAVGFLSLAVDAINEAFLDVVGDTVLEFDGEVPMLVEDYEQDVRDALGL